MLRQFQQDIVISTRSRGFYEFTDQVSALLAKADLQTGQVTLHVQHTSASLVIQENADPEVRRDFERFFARFVPDGDSMFEHTAEGEDDMSAHIRTALTAVNITIPITGGQLALGTWQGIYLWEHRTHPHRRRIIVHFIGE
jgi:secondary thiamine-phosphate synthase enzyme